MKKALLVYALGQEHEEMHRLTMPGKQRYAERHSYILFEPTIAYQGRPLSWEKIPLLVDLLTIYDCVLFLGADVYIDDPTFDIAANVPAAAWQALVVHDIDAMPGTSYVGQVPNCDVWLLYPPMLPYLQQIQELAPALLRHPWWEQAALMQLVHFSLDFPCRRQQPSELWAHTYELDSRWNQHPYAKIVGEPYFRHATGVEMPRRLEMLREWHYHGSLYRPTRQAALAHGPA